MDAQTLGAGVGVGQSKMFFLSKPRYRSTLKYPTSENGGGGGGLMKNIFII